jgi:trans-aconitate methyltransferase
MFRMCAFLSHTWLRPGWTTWPSLCGVAPPMRKERFAWCDLGCGQGVTAAVLAAMHPVGQFHGIDAMSGHIDHARRLAGEADVPNGNFHAADFASAADLALPKFDYIVAHGVYSWVGAQVQANICGHSSTVTSRAAG